MAPFDLYGTKMSAPCRIVQMTADVLGLEYNYKEVNLMTGEQMNPEYLAINPMHTVPSIVDGGFILNDSRAIAAYLVNMYGQHSKLFPADVAARGLVDQRINFDAGTFYTAFAAYVYPVMFGESFGPMPGDAEKAKLATVLGWVESFIKGGKFIAGTDHLTLADISCLATFSTLHEAGLFDAEKYPNILSWFKKCKGKIPNYMKINGEGAAIFGGFYKSKL